MDTEDMDSAGGRSAGPWLTDMGEPFSGSRSDSGIDDPPVLPAAPILATFILQ